MSTSQISVRKGIAVFALLVMGFAAGSFIDITSSANADVRRTPARQAFQSGSERSEVYLKEIAGSLKRIEARLVQMEGKIVSLKTNK